MKEKKKNFNLLLWLFFMQIIFLLKLKISLWISWAYSPKS